MLLANYPLGGMEIRFLRKALGLTQQALASVLGVDRVTVARWEGLATVDMPLSIAIRTVLAASEKSPLPHAEGGSYQKPPGAKPLRIELEAPPRSVFA